MGPGTINLAGDWLVRADPDDRGLAEGWHEWKKWPRESPTIRIPAPIQIALGVDHRGVAWVARRVQVPWRRQIGQRIWIRFESVATDATVWVNGIRVGRHVGDYIPFQFEVTDTVSGDELAIVVRVDQMYAPRPTPGVLTENGHITKGFHDVLSLQHSGVWDGVSVRRTGAATVAPNGLRVAWDAAARRVIVRAEFEGETRGQHVRVEVRDSRRRLLGTSNEVLPDGLTAWEGWVTLVDGYELETWSPREPRLYGLSFQLVGEGVVEREEQRLGLRTVATGGPGNRQILLDGKPLLIRGILHWGHEPDHIAPAPTPGQVRAEFARLKELGFNCVCLCMWYPPEHYFDIADEMGMLIWQEHPVWKSPMEEELIPEYQRLFEQFFRRDARHPSVIIVSGSCEHEKIHPKLAEWWWKRGRELLPDKLLQVQTAFIGWTSPDQTDLHDEHVYDSSGRWVHFVDDVRATIRELSPKPFVMGETIIGTAWTDTSRCEARPQWWHPKGVEECRGLEEQVRARYGEATLERFRAGAHRQNLGIRKFQSEALRSFDGCAGWVMNQIRDVPVGRLGFMDDFGAWRFSAEKTRPWLGDAAILFRTPEWDRGFTGGTTLDCAIGVSNFGAAAINGTIALVAASGETIAAVPISCDVGEVRWMPVTIRLPRAKRPMLMRLTASAPRGGGLTSNSWIVVVLPEAGEVPEHTVRLDGLPYSCKELEPDFEERAYSSGWGLKCRSWLPIVPHPEQAVLKAPVWRFDTPLPRGTRVVITHRITPGLVDFMDAGGRVVLLANKTAPGLSAKFINAWGQCPLIPEEGPLADGDSAWIADLLHLDLLRRHPRAIPVEDLGISDRVDPIIRLVFTHDRGVPKLFDAAFRARVGRGLLVASSLDHTTTAGRYFLHRVLGWAAEGEPRGEAALDASWLKGVTCSEVVK